MEKVCHQNRRRIASHPVTARVSTIPKQQAFHFLPFFRTNDFRRIRTNKTIKNNATAIRK